MIEFKIRPSFTEEDVIKNAVDADIVIVGYEPVMKKELENLPNLKMVTYRSIGFDTIDLTYAKSIYQSQISRSIVYMKLLIMLLQRY